MNRLQQRTPGAIRRAGRRCGKRNPFTVPQTPRRFYITAAGTTIGPYREAPRAGLERGPAGILALRLRSVHSRLCRSPPHLPAGIFSPLGRRDSRHRLDPLETFDAGMMPVRADEGVRSASDERLERSERQVAANTTVLRHRKRHRPPKKQKAGFRRPFPTPPKTLNAVRRPERRGRSRW
ncbi:hypothetical protein FHX03_001240 [Rhizobium sp. BK456]|nr:hypothetical protein [Rhizobium sp. BK456]